MTLKESASQTAGPYVHIGLTPNVSGITGVYPHDLGREMVNGKTKGTRITIEGRIIDGGGAVLRDALVEIWQADASGLYNSPSETRGVADPNFTGWGRCATDMETGVYRFTTIKPGAVPYPWGGMQAPHVSLWIVARGINLGLNTRMYFAEDKEVLEADPVLKRIEHKDRLPTIVISGKDGVYTFDIRLQGAGETIFFDI
jgi:protocatechuate 3,4-dioxygenase, alpha subunit